MYAAAHVEAEVTVFNRAFHNSAMREALFLFTSGSG
jgi:hypothetical protein